MKKVLGLAVIAALSCWGSFSNAGVIYLNTIGEGSNAIAITMSGSPLRVGDGYIAGGTFRTMSDAQISAATAAHEWGTLLADFEQFGESTSIARFPGIVEFSASEQVFPGGVFDGKTIYYIIGNDTDPAEASQWIIYRDDERFDASKEPVFSAKGDLLTATDADLFSGSIGSRVVLTGTPFEQFGPLRTVEFLFDSVPIIPEPTSITLLLVGAVGVFSRRRK